MKEKIKVQDVTFYGLQVAAWLVFLMVPAISAFAANNSWEDAWRAIQFSSRIMWIPAAIFFVNSFVLIPFGYYRNRRWLFWLGNAVIFGLLAWHYFGIETPAFMEHLPNERAKRYAVTSYYSTSVLSIFMDILLAGIALLIHHMYRTRAIKRQLMEEQHKRTEAELEWLKNQLNPHFLFNTLNNISSLIQLDADKAQDSIAQLSDLLRYAMYETRHETVPLQGEVEFMRNYVELMKLRCNERTIVNCQLLIGNSQLEIAPLLFISLIENAFKHGVSSSRDSRIDIRLEQNEGKLVFTCENTNFPKDDADRSGSGIGIENTRRRLDLIYKDRYVWEQSLEDNIYKVRVTIDV
jgi:two-component sensor histidine kinase